MSFQVSLGNVTSPGDGSSMSPCLLTPPLTPLSDNEVPYRPSDSDEISLNMKKRRYKSKYKKDKKKHDPVGRRHPKPAYGSETQEGTPIYHKDPARTRSLELLRRPTSGQVSPGSTYAIASTGAEASSRVYAEVRRDRRWTLPSKSSPTRGLTPLRSTVKQDTLSESPESPAMITLRRATTRKPPKRTELTFFPEPKFGSDKTGLLSYLVSTFTRIDAAVPSLSTKARLLGSASMSSDSAHPTLTYPAATVCTETTVECSLAIPGSSFDKTTPRRCSTKYSTGDTSYEIIWDENDSSTTTQGSSQPSVYDRRSSLAVMKLVSQLERSNGNTRRPSTKSIASSSTASQDSAKAVYDQALTHDKLEAIFPRLLHKTGLCDLPRSRGSKRKSLVKSITTEAPVQLRPPDGDSRRASALSIDFFSPLASRRTSLTGPVSDVYTKIHDARTRSSPIAPPSPRQRDSRLGSMVGSSSHIRRQSTALSRHAGRRESMDVAKLPTYKICGHVGGGQDAESERKPLLGSKANRRTSHR